MPTLSWVNRATLIAPVFASGILVTTVLPAEYDIEPTGIGGVLGLTAMGEMKPGEPADVAAPVYARPITSAAAAAS